MAKPGDLLDFCSFFDVVVVGDFDTDDVRGDQRAVQVEIDEPVVDAKEDVDVSGVAGQQVPPPVQLRQC